MSIMRAVVLLVPLVLAAVLTSTLAATRAKPVGTSCQMPNGTEGACKSLNECPELLALVQLPTSVRPKEFLRGCLCGSYVGRVPVVCCPNPMHERPEPPTTEPPTTEPTPVETARHPKLHLINKPGCGVAFTDRIIRGQVTERNEFPWMAVLNYQMRGMPIGTFQDECGGSLITPRFVLTAAHCINHRLKHIRLGEHDVRTDPDCEQTFGEERDCSPPTQKFTIKNTFKHPKYSTRTHVNDIALIELNQAADIQVDYVQTICLPLQDTSPGPQGTNFTVAGWGITELNKTSPVLLKTFVNLITIPECHEAFLRKNANLTLSENQICAGGDGVTDSCSGDSGSPLKRFEDNSEKYTQYGIVSYGTSRCAMKGLPAIYTSVSKYIPWILDNIHA